MKIYVGNLPFSATEQELNDLFSPFGTVASVAIINDRDTGRSRGFGFVEMASAGEAEAAIQALNGFNHDGRDLTVNMAKERSR